MTTQNPSQPSDLFFEPIVNGYLSNPRFVRRDWLAEEIDHRLNMDGSRFVLLTAEPGFGKSAFMAQLAADHPNWPRYFIRRDQRAPLSDVGARSFLLRIGFQLAALYPDLFTTDAIRLTVEQRVGTVKDGGSVVGAEIGKILASPFYQIVVQIQQQIEQVEGSVVGLHIDEMVIEPRLLDLADLQHMALIDPARAMQRLHPERQIVIALDALDEVRYHQSDDNILAWLANCPDLPSNVRFVLTSRPPEGAVLLFMDKQQAALQLLTIGANKQDGTAQLKEQIDKDLADYVDKLASDASIKTYLDGLPDGAAGFKQQAAAKADGNIGYLDALARAIDQTLLKQDSQILAALLAVKYLPDDMQGLYAFFLHQIKQSLARQCIEMVDPETGKTYDKPVWPAVHSRMLAVLAVAREPVTLEQIQYLGGITAGWADLNEAKDSLLQFLDFVGNRYRLYHATLPEFLIDEHTKDNSELQDLYIDPTAANAAIARYFLRKYGDDWLVCDDDYALKHTPIHLVVAAQQETDRDNKTTLLDKLYKLLFDPNWLLAKLKGTDIFFAIADYEYLTDREDVRSLCSALRLSAFILQHDKAQLKSQLYGRLMNSGNRAIQAFLEQIEQTNSTQWLRPIRNSLTSPDGPLLYTLEGHTDAIFDIAITPDSRYAVSASRDETLRVWDIENGTELRTLFGHGRPVRSVAITPDGRYAISASEDATIRIWDIQRGVQCGEPLNGGTVPIFSVAVSADGKTIISGSKDGVLTLWDFGSRKMRTSMKAHKGTISALKVSPNGEDVFSAACDGTLRIWNWKSLSRVDEPCPRPHVTKPMKSAIATTTPDGNKIISLVDERTLQVWSQRSDDNIIMLKGHTDLINSVCVTPDSLFAISASDDTTVRVWRLADGQKIKVLRDHPRGVDAVAISTNGKHLLSGGWDRNLKVWDVKKVIETPETANEQDHLNSVNALVITPDAKHAISASRDNNLKIWRLVDANVIHTLRGHQDVVWATAVTPDSRYVVSASWDCTLKKWDISDGKEIYTLNGHTRPVSAVAISPDGNRIVSASLDRTLKIWDLDSGTLLHTLSGHRDCVWSITITQDGRYVASGSWDRTVHIWDLQTGTHIRTLDKHPHGVTSVVSTPDNEYLISIAGYSQRILDVAKLYLPKRGKDARLSKLKYFREMKAAQKGTMNVWSMKNGELLATLALQGAVIGAITVTPDSRRIIVTIQV